MPNIVVRHPLPPYYDLAWTCQMHGWRHLAPFTWSEADASLSLALWVDGKAIDVVAWQEREALVTTIGSDRPLRAGVLRTVTGAIRRSLGLEVDTAHLHRVAAKAGPRYAALVRQGAGRLLRCPTVWEDAAKTLFTTNCSWALTEKVCRAICSPRFVPASPAGVYPFPPPEVFAHASPDALRGVMPIGYRAPSLIALARRCVADPGLGGIEGGGVSLEAATQLVSQMTGFGPYATCHLLVLAGHFGEIPFDSVVAAYVAQHFRTRNPRRFLARRYQGWGSDRWWGMKLEQILRRRDE
jgi:3-methyladenine DNA glycosylase/8-oxoguanine DNA glycosylase